MLGRRGSTLLMRFSAIGLLVTVVAAALLGFAMQRRLVSSALDEAATVAALHAHHIHSGLTASDLTATTIPESAYARVDRVVKQELLDHGGIVRVKIWSPDGVLLYCDDGRLVGKRFPPDAEFRQALAGTVSKELTDLDDAENVTERGRFDRLLSVYLPLRLTEHGKPHGVYEVYVSTDRLDATTREIQATVALGVGSGFGLLYLALFGVVLGASRRLERQNRENEQLAEEIALAYDETIEGWSAALDLKDKETEGHSHRVTDISMAIAEELGIRGEELADIRRGALLHDIGKMGIPDSILLKPGRLNEAEWEILRLHPVYAMQMLHRVEYLGRALEIPYSHHERWDGNGYPEGLAEETIPLPARIFAIADVWDALTNDRPYHAAWSIEDARRHIAEQAGKHFDPRVVDAFMRVLDRRSPH